MKPSLLDREPKALTIHQMRVFLKLVEAGSFSRTAIMVGVTQSALSRITAQMEAVLGTRLFERSGHGIGRPSGGAGVRPAGTLHLDGPPAGRRGRVDGHHPIR